jgi:hypothetical protein
MADEVQNAAAPAEVPARLDRADRLSFAITTLIALAVYLFTLAPEITLTFSGVLTTAAMYRGVGPPPGYPAWTIYSWFFIKLLPFSNPAWRVAVGSAVAGAAACGLVALIVSHSGRMSFAGVSAFERFSPRERILIRIVCGNVAGLGLAFSGGFWNEAVIQEWWTFTVLLFTIVLYLLLRWITTGRRCFCWFAFFAYGLLLTDNQELMLGLAGLATAIMLIDPKLGRDIAVIVLSRAVVVNSWNGFAMWDSGLRNWPLLATLATAFLLALIIAVVTRGIGTEWKSALACTVFLLLGLAVYFYVPIASMTDPPMNWGYSRTVEGFFHVISRGQYERVNPTTDWARFGTQLWGLLKQTGREFGWLYLVFATFPFCFFWRMSTKGRRWFLSLLPIFLCVGPALVATLNISIDRQSEDLFAPYFFALRTLLALWAGIGLILFATTSSKSRATIPQPLQTAS